MWSIPRRVTEHLVNSYRLETLDGAKLEGEFSARRLREFVPRDGTDLAKAQREYMKRVAEEEVERTRKEKEEVNNLRRKESECSITEVDTNHHIADIIGPGFFHEEEEETREDEREAEDKSIADRVIRRRGHRH
jgi:hypothetical protein